MKHTSLLAAAALAAGVASPRLSEAAWQANPPGETAIINCRNFSPIHWGQAGWKEQWKSYDSGVGWWTYARRNSLTNPRTSCDNWVNGSVAGGAGYTPGAPSLPKGTRVNLITYYYDFDVPSSWTDPSCAQNEHGGHIFQYVWGWRYNGSSWSFEYVGSNAQTIYWNGQRCQFLGNSHPSFGPNGKWPSLHLAYGPDSGVFQIANSPYAVLYTKTQVQSHASLGCGEHGCWHRLLSIVWYN